MTQRDLTARDLATLAARGLEAADARRQLELLRSAPAPPPIVRPCILGDGITQLEPSERGQLLDLWRQAADAGRITKFVPASGAATRMFADLLPVTAGDPPTAAAQEVFARRGDFAFAGSLASGAGDSLEAMVLHLVGSEGLGYRDLPKALIPFHAYPDGPRTALIEQLVEAAGFVTAGSGPIRVHFTITEGHRQMAAALVEQARPRLEARFEAAFEVAFSVQDPASDTLSIDSAGNPFRAADGALLFRPSGHGALLGNLEALGGDLVVVKNIDNIQPEHRQEAVVAWKRLLIGALVRLEQELGALAARVDRGGREAEAAAADLARLLELDVKAPDRVAWARRRLERPARVCGMVKNTGEPGGGPFWVRGDDETTTPQIVEMAQIDREDPVQEAAWRAATHFNPVDLVCSLRDRRGRPHDLSAFVDPATAFVSRKEHDGRELWALERPGLWNGAMAGWNTLFVEVPAETFAPVKTVQDLLRPEHQPPGSSR